VLTLLLDTRVVTGQVPGDLDVAYSNNKSRLLPKFSLDGSNIRKLFSRAETQAPGTAGNSGELDVYHWPPENLRLRGVV
jgi:hypothetical protein